MDLGAQQMHSDGFSLSPQADDAALLPFSPHPAPFQDAMAYIQDLMEQDDDDVPPLSSFGDVVALRSKASEFAAILKEDSPALTHGNSSDWNFDAHSPPGMVPQTSGVEDAQICLSGYAGKYWGNRVVLLNSLRSSHSQICKASNALDVNIFRRLLTMQLPTVNEKEKGDIPGLDKDAIVSYKHHETRRTASNLKVCQGSGICKPSIHKLLENRANQKNCFGASSRMRITQTSFPLHIDLHDMLLHCAHEVGLNDRKSAMEIACKLKQQASPYGTPFERLAHYFVKALDAQLAGMAWSSYKLPLDQQWPLHRQALQAVMKFVTSCPFTKASDRFVNQTILKAANGASTLHILEYQMHGGRRYRHLFKELALLPGGPPKVFLMGVFCPPAAMAPVRVEVWREALEETGCKLAKWAAYFNVPFYFTSWVGKSENFQFDGFVSSERAQNEVFACISVRFLRLCHHDSLELAPFRLQALKKLQDVQPDLFIAGAVSGAYSSPFYPVRFKEALSHFNCLYDALDTFMKRENPNRRVFESEVLGEAILNVLVCTGLLPLPCVEKYTQWKAGVDEAGLQQQCLNQNIVREVKELLKGWHKEYTIAEDKECLLLGWKGRILYSLSTWTSRGL